MASPEDANLALAEIEAQARRLIASLPAGHPAVAAAREHPQALPSPRSSSSTRSRASAS
ncbi:MAG: hypothetical protein ABIQ52_09870 [Vicinamibacterales bacterium]